MPLEELLNVNVVSTTKTAVKLRKAPGTVYRFSQEDFKSYGIKTIDDLYWFIPSVQPFRYKKNQVVVIRGVVERFNNRVQHIIDGIIARNGYYNHFEFDEFIPIDWIDNSEIILGPGSSLYGANAFAGILEVHLLDFSEQPETTMSIESQFDPSLPQATATYRDSKFVIGLTGASGDMAHPDYNIDGTAWNQLDKYELWQGFFKYNIADQGNIFIRGGKQEKPYIHNKEGREVILDKSPLVVGLDYNFGENVSFKANHTIQKDGERRTSTGENETQEVSFSNIELSYNKEIGDDNWLFGVTYLREEPDEVKTEEGANMLQDPDVTLHNYAGFGQYIFDAADALRITLGLRYDHFNEFENRLNTRAAAVYDIDKDKTLKLLFGTAIRTPSLREWNKDMADTSFIQPKIDPEEMTTYEMVYNQIVNNFYFDATLYYNVFEKMLLQRETPPTSDDPAGGKDEYFYNFSNDVKMKGLELNGKYKLEKLVLAGAYSYIDTDDGNGNDISYIRKNKFSGNLTYNYFKEHNLVVGVVGMSDNVKYFSHI